MTTAVSPMKVVGRAPDAVSAATPDATASKITPQSLVKPSAYLQRGSGSAGGRLRQQRISGDANALSHPAPAGVSTPPQPSTEPSLVGIAAQHYDLGAGTSVCDTEAEALVDSHGAADVASSVGLPEQAASAPPALGAASVSPAQLEMRGGSGDEEPVPGLHHQDEVPDEADDDAVAIAHLLRGTGVGRRGPASAAVAAVGDEDASRFSDGVATAASASLRSASESSRSASLNPWDEPFSGEKRVAAANPNENTISARRAPAAVDDLHLDAMPSLPPTANCSRDNAQHLNITDMSSLERSLGEHLNWLLVSVYH
jgi:hypothetical protein